MGKCEYMLTVVLALDLCLCCLSCVGFFRHSQKPSKECEPYAYYENKPVAPCGAIANSMFNGESLFLICSHVFFVRFKNCFKRMHSLTDSLELFYNDPNGTKIPVPLTSTGIAWWTDKHVKFRNPGSNNPNLTAVFQGAAAAFQYLSLSFLLFSQSSFITMSTLEFILAQLFFHYHK